MGTFEILFDFAFDNDLFGISCIFFAFIANYLLLIFFHYPLFTFQIIMPLNVLNSDSSFAC